MMLAAADTGEIVVWILFSIPGTVIAVWMLCGIVKDMKHGPSGPSDPRAGSRTDFERDRLLGYQAESERKRKVEKLEWRIQKHREREARRERHHTS